jgi:uncharacterized membrane protein YeiH
MFPDAIIYLDYFGTVVFAITGCLVAAKRQSDVLAFILLGLVTAVGGGTIRDLLIGRTPVFWLMSETYILICIITGFMMFIGLHHIKRIRHYNFYLVWADAIGLATFTVIGTHIALTNDIAFVPSILLGVSTACFGGVIRDIIASEETLIFRNDIYMTACLLGALTYGSIYILEMPLVAIITGFLVTLMTRGAAIIYQLKLPSHKH